MRNSDLIKILTFSAALAIVPGLKAEPVNIPEPTEMEDPRKITIPRVRKYDFNTKTYKVDFEMDDGRELSFEIADIERLLLMDRLKILTEEERNVYLEQIFNDVIPQMTEHKFRRSLKQGQQWGVVEKVRQYADDPATLLAIMITESGLKKGYPAMGGCYGSLQIKKELYDHVQKYFRGTSYHDKIKDITWEQVKNNDIKAQVKVAEAYLHLIQEVLSKHEKIKDPEEMLLWTAAAYNLGITAVSDFIRDYKGEELRWDDAKSELCSKDYIRKKIPAMKKRRLAEWKRSVTWAYGDAIRNYNNSASQHYMQRLAHRPRDQLRGD